MAAALTKLGGHENQGLPKIRKFGALRAELLRLKNPRGPKTPRPRRRGGGMGADKAKIFFLLFRQIFYF